VARLQAYKLFNARPSSASSHCQNKLLSLDSRTHGNSSMTSMTSTTLDAEQQKSRQSLSPPRSQAATISLCGDEAHSALGESKDATIWIFSDSDTEDEDEEGQVVDDSQSSTTTTTTITSHSGKFLARLLLLLRVRPDSFCRYHEHQTDSTRVRGCRWYGYYTSSIPGLGRSQPKHGPHG
jgi:hypothetical protein